MVKRSLVFVSTILPSFAFAQTIDERPSSDPGGPGTSENKAQQIAPPETPPLDEEDSIPLKQPPASPQASHAPVDETHEKARASSAEVSERSELERTDREEHLDSDGPEDEESPEFGYFALGPAMLSITGYEEYGVALGGGGRFPLHEHVALSAGVTWGLTSFDRTGEWWEEARKVGSWTTRAYGNVTKWAGEGDQDDDGFRYMAAFYAYIGLLFPYAISGVMYILGPFAATSYVDFHMEATFHLFETRKGPYVGAGLGTAAIIFPTEREMKGAFGPTFNLGYDFGWFGLEARGFYSPPYLHGEPGINRTDVFTGQFLFRFQGK